MYLDHRGCINHKNQCCKGANRRADPAPHAVVDHSKDEYVRDAVHHTNTIEGAFSQFYLMAIGICHNIPKKQLQAYCYKTAYRYNTRKADITERFENTVMKCSGVRLKYNVLIGK